MSKYRVVYLYFPLDLWYIQFTKRLELSMEKNQENITNEKPQDSLENIIIGWSFLLICFLFITMPIWAGLLAIAHKNHWWIF
jgi:hypothetical protein